MHFVIHEMEGFDRVYSRYAESCKDFESFIAASVRGRTWSALSRVFPRFAGRFGTLLLPGYCEVCEKPSRFLIDFNYSNGLLPNFRERLVCNRCGLNNRQRFMAAYFKQTVDGKQWGSPKVYMYEQTTPFFKEFSNIYSSVSVVGSEYLGHDIEGGAIVSGVRNEDALALSFDDEAFEVVISNDVFEHVPDIGKAATEAFRVLCDGGRLLFTIPFFARNQSTIKRAEVGSDSVSHLKPPVYHGNPVSEDGSLVVYDFGWDILDVFRQAGFSDVYMVAYHDVLKGYIGEGLQHLFVAEK